MQRKLRVFLCHASQDKPAVRELYKRLKSEDWIDPWLDEENLIGGQDFDLEIYKATREADAIIICLSKISVAKEGYVNKEIRRALDIAQEKLEGAIYLIPLRLDDCTPSFEQLKKLQWVDYFTSNAHERLIKSLRARVDALKIGMAEKTPDIRESASEDDGLDLFRFIKIKPQKSSKVSHPFWIAKYPVTNAQYERFLNAPDFANPVYWLEFQKFDENCKPIGDWGNEGVNWLKEELRKAGTKKLCPRQWDHEDLGKPNPNNPVVGITWYEANAYCEWLFQNWDSLLESKANSVVKPQSLRLPLETEWVIAAGSDQPGGRYPWDETGKATTLLKEILRRANTSDSGIGHTTPINQYPLGKSPFGVMDMAGNVLEWQQNYLNGNHNVLALRGGSWKMNRDFASVPFRNTFVGIDDGQNHIGFRVMCIPN
jgi:formylglycine-generating enzyme required for sulfatase activity